FVRNFNRGFNKRAHMRHGFISHSTSLTIRWACLLLLFCGLTGAIETTPAQTRAYTTNLSSNNVSVIDVASNTVIDTIPVGSGPVNIAISPDSRRAYVTNNFGNTISVIDTLSNVVIDTIPVGLQPYGIAITTRWYP